MIIKLLIEGGDMKPGPAIAQKIGPMGINMGKVISEINNATKDFKGLKVPVELDVNPKTKTFEVKVFSPPVSELIKKELGIEKGSGEAKKLKSGNIAIEQVIKISKTKYPNMLSNNLKNAVMSVVGSCVSLGVLVENDEAKEFENKLRAGKYDQMIDDEKTEVSAEKLEKLKEHFNQLKKKQEEMKKKELEAAEAEKKAKEEAALVAGKTPAAAAAVPGATPAPVEAKKDAKKEAKAK